MRIDTKSQSVSLIPTSNAIDQKTNNEPTSEITIAQEEVKAITQEDLNQAVDSMNSLMESNNSQLKFVYHDGLKEYFVQLVNSETDEVVKEIPPKKMLDAFYEMQKLVGFIIDEKV